MKWRVPVFPSLLATYVLKNVSAIVPGSALRPEAQKDSSPTGLNPLETFQWLILQQSRSGSPSLSPAGLGNQKKKKIQAGIMERHIYSWVGQVNCLYLLQFPSEEGTEEEEEEQRFTVTHEPAEGNQFI